MRLANLCRADAFCHARVRLAVSCFCLVPLLFLFGPIVQANDQKQARKALRRGEYSQALELYQNLLTENPRDAQAQLGLAETLLKLGKPYLAYPFVTQTVEQAPYNARARALLGLTLLRTGHLHAGGIEFQNALQLDERNALALAGLGEIDFYENRRFDSLRKLRLATFLAPDEPDFHYQLGQAAARNEEYSEAADAYQRFLQLAPIKDEDRRDRLRAMIQFFRYIGKVKLIRLSGSKHTTIPFELRGSRPHLKVMINGQGPFNFVLDTGASTTVISLETASKLGLKPIAQGGRARGVGGAGSFEIIYGYLNSLNLGEIKIEGVPVFFRSLLTSPGQDPATKPAGYLGLMAISKFLTTVDYQNQQLILTQNTDEASQAIAENQEGLFQIPLRSTNNGLISAETRINDHQALSFIVDTGASVSAVSKSLYERLPVDDKKLAAYRATVIGAGGISSNVEVLDIGELGLANFVHANIKAPILDFSAINETSGFEQAGILGGDFLRHFHLIFDLRQMKLLLRPQTKTIQVRSLAAVEKAQP